MVVGGSRKSSLHRIAELHSQLGQLLYKHVVIAIISDVAHLFVLVETFRVVNLVIGVVGVFAIAAVLLGVEGCHHTDATELVFRVHHIHLVTQRREIHSRRGTSAVDKGEYVLTLVMGIVDGLLEVILCPSRTARSVDPEDVSAVELVVSSLHNLVAKVDAAVCAVPAVARYGTIHIHHVHEWLFHVPQVVVVERRTSLRGELFLGVGESHSFCCREWHLLLKLLQYGVRIEVEFDDTADVVGEVWRHHPHLCSHQFKKSIHVFV